MIMFSTLLRFPGALIAGLMAGLLLLSSAARADHGPDHGIMVKSAWARPTATKSPTGAAYITLENHSDIADTLIGASSDIADITQVHETKADGNVMRMAEVRRMEIAAHGTLTMKPGGIHVMLIRLKQPLIKDMHIPVTLHFEKAGDMAVDVTVGGMGGKSEGKAMKHSSHKMAH